MIISENNKPDIEEFKTLMRSTDNLLNKESVGREAYYSKRNGTDLEEDVCDALTRCAVNTPFEGSIQLVSGASFPDIVANKYYGVEVKSTNKNHWKSIGSSILESTRDQNVERIFLTFGKLGQPIAFKSRPYEECLYGISVTHYPRYQIDMDLKAGETIFDKLGISYDTLRKMDNPVAPVSKYYRSMLRDGESLWWTSDNIEENSAAPATVRLWTALSPEMKEMVTVQGYVLFPEVIGTGTKKYNRYALWLATQKGIINTNIRDSFSAGGRIQMKTAAGVDIMMPAAFGRIKKYRELIKFNLGDIEEDILRESWGVPVEEDRLYQWCKIVSSIADENSDIGYSTAWSVLSAIFPTLERHTAFDSGDTQHLIICRHCGRKYNQARTRQLEGMRECEDDICPYCQYVNDSSWEYDFLNSKLK